MSAAALIASGLALVGAWAGFSRPLVGLGLGIGVVVVLPAAPWHVGLGNMAYPLAWLMGLEIGWLAARLSRSRDSRDPESDHPTETKRELPYPVGAWLLAAGGTFLIAAVIGWARNFTSGAEVRLTDVFAISPSGLAGRLHSSLVIGSGLLLLPIAYRTLTRPAACRFFERAFLAGTGLALLAPVVQALVGDPTARPDRGLDSSVGLVGFFQDPHSHAAYLVIALGVSLGVASAARPRSLTRFAGGVWSSAILGLLLFTNSRSGLLAAFTVVAVFVLLRWALAAPSQRWRRVSIVALVALMLGVVASVPGFRGAAYRSLSRLGNERMWEALSPEGPEDPLMARRLLLWRKAFMLVSTSPLWGTGPGGYVSSRVQLPASVLDDFAATHGEVPLQRALQEASEENAHNYYLQYAAEVGVPGLVTLIGLVASVLALALRPGRGTPEPIARKTLGLVSGLAGFLLISSLSHPLLLAEMQLLFWCSAAYALALVSRPARVPSR